MGIYKPVRDYFPGMGQAVADRTINRKNEDGTRESWEQVATRVALGNSSLTGESGDRYVLEKHLKQGSILMSGRHLQHGDVTQNMRNLEVFTNCSTSATSFLLFYLLLNGSGVGRCYDDDVMVVDWAKDMPNVIIAIDDKHKDVVEGKITGYLTPEEAYEKARMRYDDSSITVLKVKDSREGWAEAFEIIETFTYQKRSDEILILDFSDVRPHGSPIRGMQNRPSSGPGPVMGALSKIAKIRGSNIAPWEATMQVDHYSAECVLVGGARRAARMATKKWSDKTIFDFINFKKDGKWWSSNNSITIDQEFRDAITKVKTVIIKEGIYGLRQLRLAGVITEREFHAGKVFYAAAYAAYYHNTGEPGFINQDRLHANNEGIEKYLQTSYIEGGRFHIRPDTKEMLFDIVKRVMDKPYQMITNPCGEITLLIIGGYCVIADVVPFHAYDDDDAEEAFRATVRALIRTNLMDSVYRSEVSRTNRIGVGMTGFHEWVYDRFGYNWYDIIDEEKSKDMWMTVSRFKRAVVDESIKYSSKIGVNVPHTNTTFKPAGTTSKLFGLTEGAHLPSMRCFLRWVQFRNDDPLVEDYKAKGYPTRELVHYDGTTIVGFPTKPAISELGDGEWVVTAAEATPEEQYQFLRLMEKYWIVGVDEEGNPLEDTGNQISYTLKYDPSKISFDKFLSTMIDGQFTIRCCSVMPQIDTSAYEYQPEEPISFERYNELVAAIEQAENEDIGFEHVDCSSGACPIDFRV